MRWVPIYILCLLALIALIVKFSMNIPRVMNSFDGSSAGEKAIKKQGDLPCCWGGAVGVVMICTQCIHWLFYDRHHLLMWHKHWHRTHSFLQLVSSTWYSSHAVQQ